MNLITRWARRSLRKVQTVDDATANIVQYLPIAFLGVLYLTTSPVRADLILNAASWGSSGSLYVDSGVTPQINRSDIQQAIGPANVDGRVDETLEKRNSNGTLLGSARAKANFTALADTASLHVGLHGFVEAINNPSASPTPLNKCYGSARFDTSSATARWQCVYAAWLCSAYFSIAPKLRRTSARNDK